MITSNLVGGLGNYLFQIAASYSLAIDNNNVIIYDINGNTIIHNHIITYINNIFRKINFTENKLNISQNYDEPYFHYKKIEFADNIKLNGYFQSEKYFSHNRSHILDLFEIDNNTENLLKTKYSDIINNDNTCSIHIRRGDYLKLPNHHPVCDIDYYVEAMKKMGNDKYYIIFSDDISWCKENLSFLNNKIFIEGNTDFQDLYLMSKCKNNIIANSSFSWWGAWLNTNKDKIVIAPKKWFGISNSHLDTSDLYCNNWVTI
jgi:hypothetical protein